MGHATEGSRSPSSSLMACGLTYSRKMLRIIVWPRMQLRSSVRLTNSPKGVGKMKRITLALVASVLAVATAATTAAAPASAAAIVMRDTITTSFTESGVPNDCRPGVTGSLEGTEVVDFQTVETEEGFHLTFTITESTRIDWNDDTHAMFETSEHFAFNAVENGTMVSTLVQQSSGKTFSADGAFLYSLTFHLVAHVTVTNGDVTRVEFERGRGVCRT